MYKYICERCKARLDPGEKCNCEDEEVRYLRKFKLTKTVVHTSAGRKGAECSIHLQLKVHCQALMNI